MKHRCYWRALTLSATLGLASLGFGCQGGALTLTPIDPEAPGGPGEPGDPVKPGDPVTPNTPKAIDPGRVTLRRLNNAEYNNTVRELLGLDVRPADTFPPDDYGYGFNNIADVLTISPLLFEMYEKSAHELIDAALQVSSGSRKIAFEAESADATVGAASGDFWNLWSNGELGRQVQLPEAGRYRVRVRAYGQQAGPDPARMELLSGVTVLQTFDVTATQASPGIYEYTGRFAAGAQRLAVGFINDYYEADTRADRNLLVDWIEIEGPLDAVTTSATRSRVMTCEPAAQDDLDCARQILDAFALQAWRRPASTAEIDRLLDFIDEAKGQGEDWERGVRHALKAILLSPKFIFKVEQDQPQQADKPYVISQFELATRLSYFLWSTKPDDVLLSLAALGKLDDPQTLRAQVKRMLSDERAVALLDNFATQWLYIDAILEVTPDYQVFPDYSPELARDMREETRRFVWSLIEQDEPLTDLLLARRTYLNRRLAQHYGIEGVTSESHVPVELAPQTRRRGLLTHGGLLTARSYPNRTSPVLRGVWVLEQLMCDSPPPPPPDVEGLRDEGVDPNATLRERLEAHRAQATCFACHAVMDPIGFGLENYDGTGAWRELENDKPVDSFGELPDGRSFSGALELAEVLAADEKFFECAAEKMLIYALGRGVYAKFGQVDYPQVHKIASTLAAQGGTTHELITQIILSDAFRMRRNDLAGP